MDIGIIELTQAQVREIESRLEKYDADRVGFELEGCVRLGVMDGGRLIAGADACVTAFRILYVSTVFVDENYRGKGIGRALMYELESRAAAMGVNMIRLDTFDWQGADFYRKLGYEQAGSYTNEADGFSEYFFLKFLKPEKHE